MPDSLRLPLSFDADGLVADVAALSPADWVPHFNTGYYSGDWSGASLRSVGGRVDTLYPDPAASEPYADTALRRRCPALSSALSQLRCEMLAARLLRLGPGAGVREHRDHRLGYEDGEVRLHVPVITGPDATFHLDGALVPMAAGECWYVNVNRPHRVRNDGAVPRVHLVVDCVVDDWLRDVLLRARDSVADVAT